MKRNLLILLAVLAAVLALSALAGSAEDQPADIPGEDFPVDFSPMPVPATPTDLCTHENTKTIYYFDAPAYYPMNAESHVVAGRAVEEEICLDCGMVLFSTVKDNAQEVYAHVFRNNVCVLCGWEYVSPEPVSAGKEAVIEVPAGEDNPNQYFCTLTGKDLETGGSILVLRPENSRVALALELEKLRATANTTLGTIVAEIELPDGRTVNASVRLYAGDGGEFKSGSEGITLRIYGEGSRKSLSVVYSDLPGKSVMEEAVRVDSAEGEGYWSVTWLGNGTYEY